MSDSTNIAATANYETVHRHLDQLNKNSMKLLKDSGLISYTGGPKILAFLGSSATTYPNNIVHSEKYTGNISSII